MGWSNKSFILIDLINTIQKHVEDEDVRTEIYKEIADSFEDSDLEECVGEDEAFDKMMEDTNRSDPFEEDY